MREINFINYPKLLIAILGFALMCNPELHVIGHLETVPLWDDSAAIDDQISCNLIHDVIDGDNRSTLTGDPLQVCGIQVTTPSQLHGVLIQVPGQVPPGTFVYIEIHAKLLTCQNKYILITPDGAPCYIVIPHYKLQISLQGNASFHMRNIATDHDLPLVCQENSTNYIQKSKITDDVEVCPAKEFNHSISCVPFSDRSYFCFGPHAARNIIA